jgi:hypothetical protein
MKRFFTSKAEGLLLAATVLGTAVSVVAQKPVRDNLKPPSLPTCNGWSTCHVGTSICQDVTGWENLPITIAGGYALSSDGLGTYVVGSNVMRAGVGVDASLVLYPFAHSMKNPRAIVMNLNNPVPGGGGVARGVITDNSDLTVETQWYTGADLVRHNLHEIPVGTTVLADQIDVSLHINGVYHVMQMGPRPYGHCYSSGTAVHGAGTTRGTISRVSTSRWEIDLPSGSIGRLFDDHNTDVHAADKGLYYIDLHLIAGQ